MIVALATQRQLRLLSLRRNYLYNCHIATAGCCCCCQLRDTIVTTNFQTSWQQKAAKGRIAAATRFVLQTTRQSVKYISRFIPSVLSVAYKNKRRKAPLNYRWSVRTVNRLAVIQCRQLADKSFSDQNVLRRQLLSTKQSQHFIRLNNR